MKWNELLLKIVGWIDATSKPDLVGRFSPMHPPPEALAAGRLIVVRDDGLDKAACLRCPGGCGEKIMLSLSPKRWPRWQVRLDWLGRPTVEPSIRQLNECQCHFWIRRGRIDWCADSGHRLRAGAPQRANV
jgi:hypothetical protein